MFIVRLAVGAVFAWLAGGAGWAVEPNYREYGIVFNNAKNDGGFNASAVNGLARLNRETGVNQRELVIRTAAESEAALRAFIDRGVGNIMAIGYINEAPIAKLAAAHPGFRFTLIDGFVDLPNVRSVLFREEEAAFLVGMAAGFLSRSGMVGFIGAIPIPPIRRFECGFIQGVRHTAPGTVVRRAYLGDTPATFRDPDAARRASLAMIAAGADVLFAAAGLSGVAVLEAAAAAGKLGVGVDTNQNGARPGRVLTSAIKRVDTAVYLAWKAAFQGEWTGGRQILGLRENGVGWARDRDNEALVAPIAALIDQAAAEIASGERALASFMDDPACR